MVVILYRDYDSNVNDNTPTDNDNVTVTNDTNYNIVNNVVNSDYSYRCVIFSLFRIVQSFVLLYDLVLITAPTLNTCDIFNVQWNTKCAVIKLKMCSDKFLFVQWKKLQFGNSP